MSDNIKFNIPFLSGKEKLYVNEVIESRHIAGDGTFTQKCQNFFQTKYKFKKTFLTTSCTDALEMAAILINIKAGDEVILPSFTFVSTANAFLLRGAKLVFVDSCSEGPNMDPSQIEKLITPNTKAIIIMHYAGIACNMKRIWEIGKKHNLYLIEDAALGLDAFYDNKPLGSFGHFSTFSFHETKNISCGEGGMLVINDEQFIKRAEIIREKGTNRSAFFRGEIDKYGWTDIGSSFLSSDLLAAYLWAQLESMDEIQKRRIELWNFYYENLRSLEAEGKIILPKINANKKHNGSIFYLVCKNTEERSALMEYLKTDHIQSSFHYQALHRSGFYSKEQNISLVNSERFSDCLLRLPLYIDLKDNEIKKIVDSINSFYNNL